MSATVPEPWEDPRVERNETCHLKGYSSEQTATQMLGSRPVRELAPTTERETCRSLFVSANDSVDPRPMFFFVPSIKSVRTNV